MNLRRRYFLCLLLPLLPLPVLNSCSVLQQFEAPVAVRTMNTDEYIRIKRGDVLTSGKPSTAALEALKVAGLDSGECAELNNPGINCITALLNANGISNERRLSTAAELWVQQALSLPSRRMDQSRAEQRLNAWLNAARYAYAYLFFTERKPGARAFEDRQTQVRDYYNLAVQEASTILFDARTQSPDTAPLAETMLIGAWVIRTDLSATDTSQKSEPPRELLPAAALAFTGLRSQYRRDGFGAELVAVRDTKPELRPAPLPMPPRQWHLQEPGWSEMLYPVITALLQFEGDSLADILATNKVRLAVYDPYRYSNTLLQGQQVPLAGHFTAGYGLWLARSDFARKSIKALLGRESNFDQPHLYLMQPYDPDRRVILMIHGLGSSPEAWVNVANEIMGDETLRQHFQIWQVYYPTNIPIPLNHFEIRRTIGAALHHFDPSGAAPASQNMVVIGHSMGGIIARLMVSSSEDLMAKLILEADLKPERRQQIEERISPILNFLPMPEIQRAIFIAAPHRGTPIASQRLGLLLASTIRLPLTVLESFADILQDTQPGKPFKLPNSVENLKQDDRFILAAADLPISPNVSYHSIIARARGEGNLGDTDDGLVPYHSAHLPGAVSEKVIVSGHSVQETAAAILELKRILHEDRSKAEHNIK